MNSQHPSLTGTDHIQSYIDSTFVTAMGRLSVKAVLGLDCYPSLSTSISPRNKVQEVTEIDHIRVFKLISMFIRGKINRIVWSAARTPYIENE